MTTLGTIDFDDSIFDALRDEKLVVFAGAGVSIGPPSSLMGFQQLADDVAQGTGQVATHPLDRFLGELQHRKVSVHERAAHLLSPLDSAPNALHHDLIRLFRSSSGVRLVTTNFDQHFETAAHNLFGSLPDVYRAPALPLGRDFTGIVHVHGSLACHRSMVLTDADFGRAYLTEGWARRFLVEVFRRYTVLFIGYSHDDVVMNYLARALPTANAASRFALTDEEASWDLLGIKPIRFNKRTGADSYKELYESVQRLADRSNRGALDWQTRLTEIGGGAPPADEEAIGEVEQALREVHTTRFLLNVAMDSEWPRWLDARHHLNTLFEVADLSERDKLLASWLAKSFAIEHPDAIFNLIAAHGMRLNPIFWRCIIRELDAMEHNRLKEGALKRWGTILLACTSDQTDHHALISLSELCARQGNIHLTLKVFFHMSEHRLNIKAGFNWQNQEDIEHGSLLEVECPLRSDHWSLEEVWTKHLKPKISLIAKILMSGITYRLETIHQDLMAWDKTSRDWDPISYRRSAIEVHEQDRYPNTTDVLIDAGRDTLEWLAAGSSAQLDAWIERLVSSDAPILRRLAVHAIAIHPGKSADERLLWLIDHLGLHGLAEHHEVHRVVALSYPAASLEARQAVVDAVCTHKVPQSENWSAEKNTARSHYDWLSWLLQAKPNCPMARAALEPIEAQFPEWQPSDHPDLTHWSGPAEWVGNQSPWSPDQLLARKPSEQLEELLTFKGSLFHGPDRAGLIKSIQEACKQDLSWTFELAETMIERSLWSSDLWIAVIRGWQEADMEVDSWNSVMSIVAKPELHTAHPNDVASLLYAIVRDGGKSFALDLLQRANAIALLLWRILDLNEQNEVIDDWLSRAINRPAGIIVEFWISGLSLLLRDKSGANRTLPDDYREWFTMVVQDPSSRGGLGRSLLASQTAFLFDLDEAWTEQHIVPLFSDKDREKFAQAWDGFLVWGRLYPRLADALTPSFISAVARLSIDLPNHHHRFIEFYTGLAVFHISDPTEQLLPSLFQHGSVKDRISFAQQLGYLLRQMKPTARKDLWNRWLFHYWQERQQAVPAKLDEGEIQGMLDWLLAFDELFPEAVRLAILSPAIRIENSRLLYELRESDLVIRFPAETAELLIYLCYCVVGYLASELAAVAVRLPALTPDLRYRLNEALAHCGAT